MGDQRPVGEADAAPASAEVPARMAWTWFLTPATDARYALGR